MLGYSPAQWKVESEGFFFGNPVQKLHKIAILLVDPGTKNCHTSGTKIAILLVLKLPYFWFSWWRLHLGLFFFCTPPPKGRWQESNGIGRRSIGQFGRIFFLHIPTNFPTSKALALGNGYGWWGLKSSEIAAIRAGVRFNMWRKAPVLSPA